MFVLASSSKRAVGFGGVSSSDFLSPPVSARHLSGVCVCVCVWEAGAQARECFYYRPVREGRISPPAVNPQMWRVGGFYCYLSQVGALFYGDVRQKLGEKALGPWE